MVKEWIVEGQGWSRPVDGALAMGLVRQVGRAGFAQALLEQVNRRANFDHCTVYGLDLDHGGSLACNVLDAASRRPVPTARKTSLLFARRFSQLDVNRRYLGRPAGGLFASYFLSRDLPDADYREACYGCNGLVDRFSLVAVERPGRAVALNFYKSGAQGPVASAEHDRLLAHAPLLLEAATRHAALVRPATNRSGADLLARLVPHAALTPREEEVCALLLEGLSVEEAAARMQVRPTTAITLKKRGFARLGVRTLEELLRKSAGWQP